jgi:hypothetical protein
MALSSPLYTDFSIGEVSPLIEGRFDLQEYTKGLRTCENFRITPQGGLQVREGTKYVQNAISNTVASRLISFVYSRTEAYIIEFSQGFFKVLGFDTVTGEPTVFQGATALPYTTKAQIDALDVAQYGNVAYIVHPDFAPRILTKNSPTSWTLASFGDAGHILNPVAAPTPITSTMNLVVPFDIRAMPYIHVEESQVLNSVFPPVIDSVGNHGLYVAYRLDIHSTTPLAAYDPTVDVQFYCGQGTWDISYNFVHDPALLSFTLNSSDVGMVFKLGGFKNSSDGSPAVYHNYWKVTSVAVDGKSFTAKMLTELSGYSNVSGTETAPSIYKVSDFEIVKIPAWSVRTGYPSATCIHEQRLVMANTRTEPQVIWGSVVGQLENFNVGAQNESDSYVFGVASSDVSPIRWLVSCRILLVGTEGGEYRVSGTSSFFPTPLTPTSVDIRPQTPWGAGDVRPQRVGMSVFFIDRSQRKLLRLDYINTFDSYLAADMVHIAEHISLGGIKKLCWQAFPDYTLWAVRGDGQLVGLTYVPELKMQAWQRFKTDGYIESAAVIPDSTGGTDRLWVSVRRTAEAPGEIACYKFNGQQGDTYVKDEISNTPPIDPNTYEDLSGKLYRVLNESAPWSAGLVSGRLTLNGDHEFVSLNTDAVPAQGDFSIAMYIIPTDNITPSMYNDATVLRLSSNTNDFMLTFSGTNTESMSLGGAGHLGFLVNSNDSGPSWQGVYSNASSWNAGQMYFVVATFSTVNGTRMYVDGVLQSNINTHNTRGTKTDPSAMLCLGAQYGLAKYFRGGVELVRTFNRALTQADVDLLFAQPSRFIEVFDSRYQADCSIPTLLTPLTAVSTVSNLAPIAGKIATLKSFDLYYGNQVVDISGNMVLPSSLWNLYAGLPFACNVETLPVPSLPIEHKHFSNISVRVNKMRNIKIASGDAKSPKDFSEISFFEQGSEVDMPPPAFTGQKEVPQLGVDKDATIKILNDTPYGGKLLSIAGRLETGRS